MSGRNWGRTNVKVIARKSNESTKSRIKNLAFLLTAMRGTSTSTLVFTSFGILAADMTLPTASTSGRIWALRMMT